MDGRLAALALAATIAAAACTTAAPSPPDGTPGGSPEATSLVTPVDSAPRSLTPTIAGPPTNDDPPGIRITTLPFSDSTNTSQAQIHAMELASPCGSGSRSVWYRFTATAEGTLVADTLGSDYDTILDIWMGALTNDRQEPGFERLTPLACNDNSGSSLQSEIVFAATPGQSYVFRVTTELNATGGTLAFHLTAG